MNVRSRNQKTPGFRAGRAQAIVEFALVLPILMMMLVGIFEVGRLIFIYAAVNNASREAARYGSAIGLDVSGNLKYQYCDGIKGMARRSAYFTPLTITITYDHGPGTGSFHTCTGSVDTGVQVNTGTQPDRVQVTVSANYRPLINLIPIGARTITSTSARTILGYLDVESGAISGGSSSSSGPTSTTAPSTPPTAVPSNTFTATVQANTPTATVLFASPTANVSTLTPSNTPTLTFTPSITPTATLTFTPTMTLTPTASSTPVPGCGNITHGPILTAGSTMSMTITNPHDVVTVSSVQVTWNTFGGPNGSTLTLDNASIVGTFWTGSAAGPTATITPLTTLTIQGNNTTSMIVFGFNRAYKTVGTQSIIINLSTPGCESYPIHNP